MFLLSHIKQMLQITKKRSITPYKGFPKKKERMQPPVRHAMLHASLVPSMGLSLKSDQLSTDSGVSSCPSCN